MKFLPHIALSSCINHYWIVEGRFSEVYQFITYLPKGVPFMTISLSELPRLKFQNNTLTDSPVLSLNGQTTGNTVKVGFKGEVYFIGIDFTPTGLYRLLGIPMSNFTDRAIDFEDIFSHKALLLIEQLQEAEDIRKRLTLLDEFFIKNSRFKENLQIDKSEYAVTLLQDNENISLDDLAGKVNVGQRQMRRLFNECIGISPKQFASVSRFRKAYLNLQYASDISMEELAFRHGYFDLSHMIKDFKKYTGSSFKEITTAAQKKNDNYFKLF